MNKQALRAETVAANDNAQKLFSITKRWKEHFSEVLNTNRHHKKVTQENVVKANSRIGITTPTKTEIKIVRKHINTIKTPR